MKRCCVDTAANVTADHEKRIKELEETLQKTIPILKKKAWHLNMEFFTASGRELDDIANEFKQLLEKTE